MATGIDIGTIEKLLKIIHKKIQKFAKNHNISKIFPHSKINDENDLTI
jgi:hypothetical protein